MAQWAKEPALSLPWLGFNPWLGNLGMLWAWPEKNNKKTESPSVPKGFFSPRVGPVVYGSSKARGQIRAAAAGLCHSHSN